MPVLPLLAVLLAPATLTPVPLAKAVLPYEAVEPLIPKPQDVKLDYTNPIPLTGVFAFPAGQFRYWSDFKIAVGRRFNVPAPAANAKPLAIDGGINRMHKHPGAYTLDLTDKGVSILGEEDEGLRNGVQRLARLVFARDGKLWLPKGHLYDEPQITYRGVELGIGPEARPFQRRLWDRVLLPLGFNEVVLDCAGTGWKNTPVPPSNTLMPREDLVGIFADYRKLGIEPTPLIDSFGHMDWFLAGRRSDLALNPTTIDPRKPESVAALGTLWGEVSELVKPTSMHFGCDNVPGIDTDLWRVNMKTLGSIAKGHGAKMMLWGDMALAPNEAPVNAHAPNPPEAALRRAAVPYGATVFDFQSKDDPNTEDYYPTYQIWKREDHPVIAAAGSLPNNVMGVDLAANLERIGTLQRVRTGEVSSEAAMLDNLPQFTALVLSGDYSWSGRQEPPAKLGYDPAQVFRRMYFGEPEEVRSVSGTALTWATERRPVTVGRTNFLFSSPLEVSAATHFGVTAKGSRLYVAATASQPAKEGVPVAEIIVQLGGGKTVTRRLVYGHHLREAQDAGLVPYGERGEGGVCAIPIALGAAGSITGVTIKPLSGNLELYGLTLR